MDPAHGDALIGSATETDEDEDGVSEPYWIVQNSWTDKWKDAGRVKIARGENACCIEDRCVHLYFYSRTYGQL